MSRCLICLALNCIFLASNGLAQAFDYKVWTGMWDMQLESSGTSHKINECLDAMDVFKMAGLQEYELYARMAQRVPFDAKDDAYKVAGDNGVGEARVTKQGRHILVEIVDRSGLPASTLDVTFSESTIRSMKNQKNRDGSEILVKLEGKRTGACAPKK